MNWCVNRCLPLFNGCNETGYGSSCLRLSIRNTLISCHSSSDRTIRGVDGSNSYRRYAACDIVLREAGLSALKGGRSRIADMLSDQGAPMTDTKYFDQLRITRARLWRLWHPRLMPFGKHDQSPIRGWTNPESTAQPRRSTTLKFCKSASSQPLQSLRRCDCE